MNVISRWTPSASGGWSPFGLNLKQVLAAPRQLLASLGKSILNLLFPPYCLVCNSILEEDERLICELCWHDLPLINENRDLLNEIQSKFTNEIYFFRVIAIWEFSPTIQIAIHHLKYQNFKILANRIGVVMAERLNRLNLSIENTILIPVPLHKTRIRERGYNQSALLCHVIASQTGFIYHDHVLKRIRYTQSQTKLNVSERLKNVHKAFKVASPQEIQNKSVILVDDVITTGATANECARELIRAGAETVYLCSAAKA